MFLFLEYFQNFQNSLPSARSMKKKVLFSLYVDVLYLNSKQIPKSGTFLTNYQGSFYWPIVINQNATSSKNAVIRKKEQRERNAPEWMISFFPFPNVFSWSNFHGLGSSIAIKRKRKRNEKKHRKFLQLITYPSETDMCVCIF